MRRMRLRFAAPHAMTFVPLSWTHQVGHAVLVEHDDGEGPPDIGIVSAVDMGTYGIEVTVDLVDEGDALVPPATSPSVAGSRQAP